MAINTMLELPALSIEPRRLPFAAFPTAADTVQHGLQPLPTELPLVDFARAEPYRSGRYPIAAAEHLTPGQLLDVARVVGSSFARREPQCRHLRLPALPFTAIVGAEHRDALGAEQWGQWSMETLLYWFIRLLMLTDPSSPRDDIALNDATLVLSLAMLDRHGSIVGGALNEMLPPLDILPALRQDDPFLAAVLACFEPVMELLMNQDAEALTALCAVYPAFGAAYAAGRVGHHVMVARSDALATVDAFELVAASAEHFQQHAYAYMVVEATNQWTGAACEMLDGVRVHFSPFRVQQAIARSAAPLPDRLTSPDGFLSGKDSGSMFYVLRLA